MNGKQFLPRLFHPISSALSLALTSCILLIRPLLGPAICRFHETCTPYAIRQLKEKPIHAACLAIIRRLIACRPF